MNNEIVKNFDNESDVKLHFKFSKHYNLQHSNIQCVNPLRFHKGIL
jgi:hypothetical protein